MIDNFYQFHSFETEEGLFDLYIDGVPVWERIRFKIHRKIEEQSGVGQPHTSIEQDTVDYIKGGLMLLKNSFIGNPYFCDDSDLLFVGHPRRKEEPDGYWWDIYSDPIHESCEFDYVHLEFPRLLNHNQPARTDDLRYLDIIKYGSKLQRRLRIRTPEVPEESQQQLVDVQKAIRDRFGADIDFVSLVHRELHVRNTRLWMYRRLLNRIDPEVVVIVVSYGKETFIEACQSKGIPVVELQHGVIHSDHLGYSYSGSRTKEMFPDYFLTWGEFWEDRVELPIPDNRVIPVGYPYLEQRRNQYTDIASKDQILFISQGTIGEPLSKFAIEVDQHPDIDYNVMYKLHPGEYDRWREEYPWLVNADFEVIDGSQPPLYQLFAESSVQVGVGSTAIYEGLAFDLETYVYDCPGSEILEPVVAENSAEIVSSVEEFIGKLGTASGRFDRDRYFAPDATEQVCAVLDDLCDSENTDI